MLACLSCYVSPVRAWPLSFLGLGFPFIFIVVAGLLILGLTWRRRSAWLNLAVLILSWPFIHSVVSFHSDQSVDSGVRVMTYNVRNFDLYNWSHNKETHSKIMKLIADQSPDILCLQEFYTDDEDFHNVEYLRDSLGYPYAYFHRTYSNAYHNKGEIKEHHYSFGLAVFSRFPVVDTGVVHFAKAGNNQCIYADLDVNGKQLRVYTAHLQSIHLNDGDYDALENKNTNWNRIKNIFRKMKRASVIRAGQAECVSNHVNAHKGNKIVCGDFNDSPISYTYQTVSKGLTDAFIAKGNGISKSFSTNLGFYRIDFVLADPGIRINSYRCIPKELSDHYPVVVTMDL